MTTIMNRFLRPIGPLRPHITLWNTASRIRSLRPLSTAEEDRAMTARSKKLQELQQEIIKTKQRQASAKGKPDLEEKTSKFNILVAEINELQKAQREARERKSQAAKAKAEAKTEEKAKANIKAKAKKEAIEEAKTAIAEATARAEAEARAEIPKIKARETARAIRKAEEAARFALQNNTFYRSSEEPSDDSPEAKAEFWAKRTHDEIRELVKLSEDGVAFTTAGESTFVEAWSYFKKFWHQELHAMFGYMPCRADYTVGFGDMDWTGRVSMQTLLNLAESSRNDWLRMLSRQYGSDSKIMLRLMERYDLGPAMVPASSTIQYLRPMRHPSKNVFVRHRIAEKPTLETRGVKLVASILAGHSYLPIAKVEETVHFMDRQSNYSNFITHDEYRPYFDALLWCWERQQQLPEEARARVYGNIDARLGSIDLNLESPDSNSQLPDSNETSKEPMTVEELKEALERQTFMSHPRQNLTGMRNQMRQQEPSNQELDDAFEAGLRAEGAQWEYVEETGEGVNEVEEQGMEEAIDEDIEEDMEDDKDEVQEDDEPGVPTRGRGARNR